MDLIWSVVYSITIGSLVWLLHSRVGEYPRPLLRSENRKRDIWEALSFWIFSFVVSMMMTLFITPALDHQITNRTLRELVLAPLLGAIYVLFPILVVRRVNGWTLKDFGVTWKSQSRSVTLFAVMLGVVTGGIAYITNQTVMGIDLLPWGALILLLFTNSFTEEFFHRGVIQSLLERTLGQRRAILWGGILFGLTHIVFDVVMLMETGGIMAVFFAMLLQTMGGWLFGMLYMKTRSLLPGIVFHYLVNWLPSILLGIMQ